MEREITKRRLLGVMGILVIAGCLDDEGDAGTEEADDDESDDTPEDDSDGMDDENQTDEGSTDDYDDDHEDETLDELDREDVVEFVSFDPVVNEAFVEVAADPPVDEIVLTSEVAGEETLIARDETDETHSVPVDHEGDTLSIVVVANDSEAVVHEEEWSPPTADDFDDEIIDDDGQVVEEIEIVDDDIGYTAQVNFVEDIEATEIHIASTVAQGEFHSDTLDGMNYASVQINAVRDEVTVTAHIDGDEEVVHREHLEP